MLYKHSKCSIKTIYASAIIEEKKYKASSEYCSDNMLIKGTPGIKLDGFECLCECHVIGHSVRHIMPCCDKIGMKYMIDKNR